MCRYKERPEKRLLPIADDYFLLEGYDDRRIRFTRKGADSVALTYIYSDGYQTTAPRN